MLTSCKCKKTDFSPDVPAPDFEGDLQKDPRQAPIAPDREVNVESYFGKKGMKVPYESNVVKKYLDTADIVLYQFSYLTHKISRIFTQSKYDHVGIVVLGGHIPEELLNSWKLDWVEPDELLVLHMMTDGMRLDLLVDEVKWDKVKVSVRHLQVERSKEMIDGLQTFLKKYKDNPYQKNFVELVKCVYDGPGGRTEKENLNSLFCSQMVAKCYQMMHLLHDEQQGGLISSEYAPRDFTSKIKLPLLQNAVIENEVELTPTAAKAK